MSDLGAGSTKKREQSYVSDASDSENSASAEHEGYHESCWKRDGRLKPVHHIPRVVSEKSDKLHSILTDKKQIAELALAWEGESEKTWKAFFYKLAKKFFPIVTWLPELLQRSDRWSVIQADVIAGITVGVMAIPQSMSYADIAGLKYVYGMYAIFITCLVYGLTGESRQLGVGPVAMVSLIVEAGLTGQITEESCPAFGTDACPKADAPHECCRADYQSLVFTCSLLVGIINIVGGLMNLGFLVNFLAH